MYSELAVIIFVNVSLHRGQNAAGSARMDSRRGQSAGVTGQKGAAT